MLTNLHGPCRFPPVCIDAEIIKKGVEEGQMAVRRALTPYAGSVPPSATSSSPESTSVSETQSLESLNTLVSSDLESSLESDEEGAEVRRHLSHLSMTHGTGIISNGNDLCLLILLLLPDC